MKIKVKQLESKTIDGIETAGKIEMVRYEGGLINLGGKTLPF